jgi:hypothetical protein
MRLFDQDLEIPNPDSQFPILDYCLWLSTVVTTVDVVSSGGCRHFFAGVHGCISVSLSLVSTCVGVPSDTMADK